MVSMRHLGLLGLIFRLNAPDVYMVKENCHSKKGRRELLCEVHHLRAEKRKGKIGIFRYTYVVCRSCGISSRLVKGIKEVIGLIGGDINDYKIDGDKFYVNLWDNKNKKARNADIDLLEIRNSANINYGLAIASVYTTLVNDVSRPRNWLKNISVVLKGNPPIPKDSMKDLKRRFREVKVK